VHFVGLHRIILQRTVQKPHKICFLHILGFF